MYRWCLYQVVFFFIFCKDNSEMLRLSKKLSNFSMLFYSDVALGTRLVLQRNAITAANDVSRGQNRYVRLLYIIGLLT
jgi:hypothetical protein